MQMARFCWLEDRGVIAVEGPDARSFLQGIVSNDVTKVKSDQALWSAFLTPQGKYLYDFFLLEHEGALLLDCEVARLGDLLRRLKLYKLRSKVDVSDVSDAWRVAAVWGADAAARLGLPAGAGKVVSSGSRLAFVDPRHAAMGARLLQPVSAAPPDLPAGDRSDWEALRIRLGLPDGSRDMEVDKAILLENGFDELGGVDWKKGCFMGQELTARTKYRGLVKKRLLPIEKDTEFSEESHTVEQEGRAVGELRSRNGRQALALLRLQALENEAAMTVEGEEIRVALPEWIELPQPKPA